METHNELNATFGSRPDPLLCQISELMFRETKRSSHRLFLPITARLTVIQAADGCSRLVVSPVNDQDDLFPVLGDMEIIFKTTRSPSCIPLDLSLCVLHVWLYLPNLIVQSRSCT